MNSKCNVLRANKDNIDCAYFEKKQAKKSLKSIIKKTGILSVIFVLVGGTYFNIYHAQGAVYTFVQTNWVGGQTVNVADHTNDQSGWDQYSNKDANLTLINSGADLQLVNSTSTTNVNYNTESNYIQQNATDGTDFSGTQVMLHAVKVVASGGTGTTFGDYTVRKFIANDTLTVTSPGNIDYLVVGGGGSGGGGDANGGGGGGGGGGGVVYQTGQNITIGSHAVTVGVGGTSGYWGVTGGNSVFQGFTALGGGGGAFAQSAGLNGGSGGGGSRYSSPGGTGQQPSSASGGFGRNGGAAYSTRSTAGGGGGAGGIGATATSSTIGANGGLGKDYGSIFGTTVGDGGWFASGGGGGGQGAATRTGTASAGGGGGGGSTWAGVAGQANTGGGGSGGDGGTDNYGGVGGSGIVIVRYLTNSTYPTTPYYITTNATSQKNTSTWGAIQNISTTQTTPINTNIKYLVSFDNRTTWKYWNGSSWQTSTLANIATNGMTKSSIEALTATQWNTTNGFTPGTFDIAASLSTTDTAITPSLDNIQISYTNPQTQTLTSSTYNTELDESNISDLQWTETTPSNTDVKLQIRTSADGTNWSNWCGPDNGVQGTCSSSTYFTDPTGASENIDDIQRDESNDQYIQYKVFLSTTDGQSTPTCSDVTVSYDLTVLPVVATQSASNITYNSATLRGEIINTGDEDPTRTIEYGTTTNTYTDECTAGTGAVGIYSCNITNLTPNTTYYYKAKATNSEGTTYGDELSFTTLKTTPTVTTQSPSDITTTTATAHGTITTTGGENPTRQIEWGTQTLTYTQSCTAGVGGTGTYTCAMTGLFPNTTYYVRSKATNSEGTTYGDEVSFNTQTLSGLTIPDPDTTDISEAVTDGYMSVTQGTQTSAHTARANVDITLQTSNNTATFPTGTNITGDGDFNFQQFTIQPTNVTQDHPTSRAAIDLGIPGEQLSFSEDITMQIYVGTVFNDHQMEVLYQNDGESDWHHHTDCTVTNGQCTFQTNHATIYTINGVHQATGDLPLNINVEVQETLSMDCFDISDSNTTVQIGTTTDPGKVTAGTPAVGQSRCTVTTNADQGYYLTLVNDNTTTHPTLTHTDPNTSTIYEIEDLTQYATNTPNIQNWTAPTTKGLGFSVIHFPQTDISHNTLGNIWTETNACPEGTNPDTNDYAGIPETPQTITAVTAYQETATTTDICYKVDVLPSQPSGQYTGSVTFTATSDASGYYQ